MSGKRDDSSENFFSTVPVFRDFAGIADDRNYRPLPAGWFLALADVTSSTQAIAAGRYKDVNLAGAAVISAVLNAIGKGDYPFAFGGDGAVLALPGELEAPVRQALAATRAWAAADLDLHLRVAVVPVEDIRAQGLDVRVARHAASDLVSYAMFSGGGARFADEQMKRGHYRVEDGPPDARPDLTGLSCRWSPLNAEGDEILSLIVLPLDEGHSEPFKALLAALVSIAGERGRGGHPVPGEGPALAFSMEGVEREVRLGPGNRLKRRLAIVSQILLISLLYRLNLKIGRFDARRYRSDVGSNSDFRKFDDGLKMTVDVTHDQAGRMEKLLETAKSQGIATYGLHRQGSALMTCFVPTPLARDHIHFIDGGEGGYAVAASQIKSARLSKADPATAQ